MSVYRNRGTTWYVRFRWNGHSRVVRRSPVNTRAGAEAYEATLRWRLARGLPLDIQEDSSESSKTFGEFAEQWFDCYVRANNKPSEQQAKRRALDNHILPMMGHFQLSRVSVAAIEDYKIKKVAAGLSNKTINNHLAMVSTCLREAVDWGELENAPRIRRLKVSTPEVRFLDPTEIKALLISTSEPFWDVMVATALHTGLRRGELMGLQWKDIDNSRRIVTVRRSALEGHVTTPKSNKHRHVPVGAVVVDLLSEHPRRCKWVFPREDGRLLSGSVARAGLARKCRRAGVEPIGWHTLRHTFASYLAMEGESLWRIQQLLGHSSITTTERYAHLLPNTLHSAVERLSEAYGGQQVGNNAQVTSVRSGRAPVAVPTLADSNG